MRYQEDATVYLQLKTPEPFVLISGAYTVEQYLDIEHGMVRQVTMSESDAIRTFGREGALTLPVQDGSPRRLPDWLPEQLPPQQLNTGAYPLRYAGAFIGSLMLVIRNEANHASFTLLLEQLFVFRTADGPERGWVVGGTNGLYRDQWYHYQGIESQGGLVVVSMQIVGEDHDQLQIVDLALADIDLD